MRLLALAAVALLGLAACGPDCQSFCDKQAQCFTQVGRGDPDVASCVTGCDNVKSDSAHYIDCYLSHTCTEIYSAGACSVTGGQ